MAPLGRPDPRPIIVRSYRPYSELDLAQKDEKGFELQEATEKLARLKSLRPIPLIRTSRHLGRRRRKLEERLAKLQQEISLLEGIETPGMKEHDD